jgi:hypothetical protein
MRIKIELNDIASFTKEEAIDRIKTLLGKSADVSAHPESDETMDVLRFALIQLVGYNQLCILNDSPYEYDAKIRLLKKEILAKVESELDSVILANECKFNE